MWIQLMPAEVEKVMRPTGNGGHAELVKELQQKLSIISGEIELSKEQVVAVRHAVVDWQGGCQTQLQALMRAFNRHSN